ncbi:MAG: TetR/AcrR family transcriptional regulator [Sphaerochaetaceae bacterium]|nr:TetR/AcrR family transcriptional regulator [Sphaerochaetaceae bacterium]
MKDTREKILTQALAYFSQHDYERTSLNDIAGALGITKGAIYHYFASKDELLKESVLSALENIGKVYEQMGGRENRLSFKEKLALLFDYSAINQETEETVGVDTQQGYIDTPYVMFAALKKFPEVGTAMNDLYAGFITAMTVMLEQAAQEGEIRPDLDLPALAFEISALVEGSMLVGSVLTDIDVPGMGRRMFENFWLRINMET